MNQMNSISALRKHYVHADNHMYFHYTPSTGVIRCQTRVNMLKCAHHLGMNNIPVDWVNSKVAIFVLQVEPMTSDADEDTVANVLSFCQYYEDSLNSELYKNNVDNRTGLMLQWNSLKVTMSRMINDKSFDRTKVANWFNGFNIETIRPEEPLMIVSTKSKATIVDEGKKWIERLYSKGELIKYTKEETKCKLEKYAK